MKDTDTDNNDIVSNPHDDNQEQKLEMFIEQELGNAFDSIKAPEIIRAETFKHIYQSIPPKNKLSQHLLSFVASFFLIILLGIGSTFAYFTETSAVSIDINPSIELGLNRFNRVISATGYNTDGTILLSQIKLQHKSYKQAMETLLENEHFIPYLTEDNTLLVTIVSNNDKVIDKLTTITNTLEPLCVSPLECYNTNNEIRSIAHSCGFSAGKYNTYLELKKLDNSITLDDCKDLSAQEIKAKIEDYNNPKNKKKDNEDSSKEKPSNSPAPTAASTPKPTPTPEPTPNPTPVEEEIINENWGGNCNRNHHGMGHNSGCY